MMQGSELCFEVVCSRVTRLLQVQQRMAAADIAYQESIKKQRQKSYKN